VFLIFVSGFKPAKHMVFAGVYPADGSDYDALCHAIERLTCNDASVSVTKESSGALGIGFRFGPVMARMMLVCIFQKLRSIFVQC
jgi:translation elongation factor EF-4